MTDAAKPKPFDMDQALLDPGSVFATPDLVLLHDGLSKAQKIEILRRWEYDASEGCVAAEEGMPAGESDLLRRILLALGRLSGGIDVEHVGPTKHHGIPSSAAKSK